ncbi:MAG: hypothetical protein WAV50_00970 [Minisyncoccia bacterium]
MTTSFRKNVLGKKVRISVIHWKEGVPEPTLYEGVVDQVSDSGLIHLIHLTDFIKTPVPDTWFNPASNHFNWMQTLKK